LQTHPVIPSLIWSSCSERPKVCRSLPSDSASPRTPLR